VFLVLYFSILLHYVDLTYELLCRLCATSLTILSSCSLIGKYVFRPNWPSSGVQVVMVKGSAAHCNAVFFPPIVVASGYLVMWVSLGCTWLLLVLLVVAVC
jgi:hypothetical protein